MPTNDAGAQGDTWPTKSFLGAMAGSGGSPGRIFFGLANATTRGRLPAPCSRVRPSWASIAASAASKGFRQFSSTDCNPGEQGTFG